MTPMKMLRLMLEHMFIKDLLLSEYAKNDPDNVIKVKSSDLFERFSNKTNGWLKRGKYKYDSNTNSFGRAITSLTREKNAAHLQGCTVDKEGGVKVYTFDVDKACKSMVAKRWTTAESCVRFVPEEELDLDDF